MKRILLFVFLLGSASLFAQVEDNRLSAEQFVHWVDKYHPVLKAVRNKLPIAKAELLKARGQFDPALVGNLSSKNAGDILYYSLPVVGLAIPTATPVDLEVNWIITPIICLNFYVKYSFSIQLTRKEGAVAFHSRVI